MRFAALLGRSTRTLRNWRARAADPAARPVGRPPHPEALRQEVALEVMAEIALQGASAGWRAIAAALPGRPRRVVQEQTARAKARRRARCRLRAAAHRLHVEVAGRDVLWSLDATHIGRSAEGTALEAQALRDVATLRTLALTLGEATTTEDAMAVVELAATARGGRYPLVLSTDNGAAYTSERFERFLEEHDIVHLRTLPHTPRHNPWVERGHRDLKDESGLGKGVLIEDLGEAAVRLLEAVVRVDSHRRRATLGYQTASTVDAQLEVPYDDALRARLGEEVRRRTRRALQCQVTGRARRALCREAVLAALEELGMITRTRGGRPLAAVEPEAFS